MDLDFGALNTAASWRQKTFGFFEGTKLKATENILGMYRFFWIAYQVEQIYQDFVVGMWMHPGLGAILRLGGDMVR